jgi:hypothetical protein
VTIRDIELRRFLDRAPGYPFAQPGDIFFTRGTNTLGRLIRWAERSKGEAESWANHMGGITKPGYLVPPVGRITALATATEALWHVKEHTWWTHHKKSVGYAVAVYRPRLFSGDEGVERVVANWRTRTGNRYGWWRLTTFLGEKLTHGKIPFTKLHFQDARVVCSNHIALGLEDDKIRFNDHDPNELDPDEGMDYCAAHPEEFKFIGWGIVPKEVV